MKKSLRRDHCCESNSDSGMVLTDGVDVNRNQWCDDGINDVKWGVENLLGFIGDVLSTIAGCKPWSKSVPKWKQSGWIEILFYTFKSRIIKPVNENYLMSSEFLFPLINLIYLIENILIDIPQPFNSAFEHDFTLFYHRSFVSSIPPLNSPMNHFYSSFHLVLISAHLITTPLISDALKGIFRSKFCVFNFRFNVLSLSL